MLQFCLHPWKQELCYSSSILRQLFHITKYCHYFHAYSKCFYTEPLPTYPATGTLAAVGWERKHLHFWFWNIWHLKFWNDLCKSSPRLYRLCLLPMYCMFFRITSIPDSSCGRSVSSKSGIFALGVFVPLPQPTLIYCLVHMLLQAKIVINQHW